MTYGKKLLELRGDKKITQITIAKIIGIDHSQYSHYELEDRDIPIKHLITLANYFNVSIDYLFCFTNEKKYNSYNKDTNSKLSGQRIKEFRKSLKKTQQEFGNILTCSYGTIAGYESGRYLIATPFLYTICDKYNISADYLLGKIDSPKYLTKD